MIIDDISDYIILSDFDGTITLLDSTDQIVKKYGSQLNKNDELLFIAGEISNREAIVRHFETMRLSPDIYYGFMLSIPIDPTFLPFYKLVREKEIPFSVISGGFTEGIERFFAHHGLDDIKVLGNHAVETDGAILLSCADPVEKSYCRKGSCANCKTNRLFEAKKTGKKIIYIGDGLTDECVSKYADVLFAKDSLAQKCIQNHIPYEAFDTFKDIQDKLFV